MNKSKKIISVVAAATLAFSTLAVAGCGKNDYKGEALTPGYVLGVKDDISSNGGFAVEKGGYVYFINGAAESKDDNVYGDVVKGALMRISKADLAAGGNYADKAQIVVPSLFVAGDYSSGVYIYGDYVYYATPTTSKNKDGEVDNASLDFKRAKLDGSEAPMDGNNEKYFFRLTTNGGKYRYVQNAGSDVVYCLYEEEGALKSYNTETGVTTTLVKGASSYFYDTNDVTNPNVYYTMSVTYNPDSDASYAVSGYNQIYSVNAAATVSVDTDKAAYTAYDKAGNVYKSYDFDEEFLKSENKKFKEDKANKNAKKEDLPYDLDDYTTYPYVNLGQLVLDGIGWTDKTPDMRFHNANESYTQAETGNPAGYTYTVQQYTNDGIYYTRTNNSTDNTETAKLYYLSDARSNWNSIAGNALVDVVSNDTTSASASALYEIDADGNHVYIYTSGTQLKRTTVKDGVKNTVILSYQIPSGVTLWKTEGDYLYYYSSGSNGNNLVRINYKGATQDDYKWIEENDDSVYASESLSIIDWSDSWYKPELVTVDGKLIVLYPSAQAYGKASSAFNYIYAAEWTDVKTKNEEMKEIDELIGKGSSDAQAVMEYFYKTGSLTAYEAVREDLYKESVQKEVEEFVEKFNDGTYKLESKYASLLGRINEEDAEEIAEGWADFLLHEEEEEEEEEGLETWAIVLIVIGSVLVAAGGVTIPTIIVVRKKKAKKRRDEAVVNAYKRKRLDTTDDKSIDVYTDESEEAEEPAAEPVEETEETPVETEAVEESEPAEKAPVEE